MLEKLLKNKKIWIPIVVVVVVIAIVFGVSVGKDADDTNGKEQSNISSGIDKDKEQSNTGSGTDKNNENGLTEVDEEDTQTEDTITPPESWDDNEDSSNISGNKDSNANGNANGNSNGNSNDKDNKDNQEPENDDDKGMSSGEVFEDKDNKQFGTIF